MTIRKNKPFYKAVFVLFIGLIISLGLSSSLTIPTNAYAQDLNIPKESIEILSKTNQAMVELTAAVKPAIVNISSTKTIKTPGAHAPFWNDPFFRRFFGDEFGFFGPREFKQASLGSGVIVDKNGYILTNYHVIKDADEIKVRLSDKKEFKGKIIGTDPKTDLAVIKIDASNLPVVKWGDSDKLKVGEMVIAIGNPYGLSQTVTSGIVSATGRANVGIADYEDFIQTDAAINPGNSGGALVNIKGEMVGINTAIFSTTGGYQGIGFAIPSNMAKAVMENLIKHGKVIRGWLGVTIQPVTSELAKQFNLKEEKGVIVTDVVEESPAEKAGLKRGDVIIEYDGRETDDPASLRNMVATTTPNKEVKIKIIRDGKFQTLKVTIAELPVEMQSLSAIGGYDNVMKGVHVQNLTPEIIKNLNLPKKIHGVIVANIEVGSPSYGVLAKNDIIMEINRKKINDTKDYESVVSQIKPGEGCLLLIYRNGSTIYVTLSPQ